MGKERSVIKLAGMVVCVSVSVFMLMFMLSSC